MQKNQKLQNQSFVIDQRNIMIAALIIVAIVSAVGFLIGFNFLVGIAWVSATISAMILMGTALWLIRHPELYPRSASLPQRAKIQLIGSILMSVVVVLSDRIGVFSLSPALFGLLQAGLLAITTIQLLALSSANLHLSEAENKIQETCQVLRTLQLDLERIARYAKDTNMANDIHKLAEAVRFSDPVSSNVLAEIECKLQKTIGELDQAVQQDNIAQFQLLLKKATILLEERNHKCLASK